MVTDKRPENLVGDIILEYDNLDSFTVDPNLTAGVSKGDLVSLNGDKQITLCPTGTRPVGVAYKATAAGQLCPVMKRGKSKLVAYGTISAGDLVGAQKASNGSRVVTVATSELAFGTALQGASSGDSIEVSVGLF